MNLCICCEAWRRWQQRTSWRISRRSRDAETPVSCPGNDASTAQNETTTAVQPPRDVCRTPHLRKLADLQQRTSDEKTAVKGISKNYQLWQLCLQLSSLSNTALHLFYQFQCIVHVCWVLIKFYLLTYFFFISGMPMMECCHLNDHCQSMRHRPNSRMIVHGVSKNVTTSSCYNFDIYVSILIILAEMLLRK